MTAPFAPSDNDGDEVLPPIPGAPPQFNAKGRPAQDRVPPHKKGHAHKDGPAKLPPSMPRKGK